MIDRQKIDIEWINKVSAENGNLDKILLEKVIRAFLLLEGLSAINIPFVFKGGTSLMLLLNTGDRLSIDIDIIVPKQDDNLFNLLKKMAQQQGFTRVEQQERNMTLIIPKNHYKFYYSPVYQTAKAEEYVMLDILFEQIPYNNIHQKEISSGFIPVITPPSYVNVPSAEDLLGDKLTAFAPNTIGIPYTKNRDSMSMEIIKQLYDIGCLFDVCNDFKIIASTFKKIAGVELQYREKKCDINDAIEDIFQTALCISSRNALGKGNFAELQAGISRVKGFVFSEKYQIEKAIISASKAAYLSMLLYSGNSEMEKYKNPLQIKNMTITNPKYNKLNKLKKTNSEAFFYWNKTIELRMEQ